MKQITFSQSIEGYMLHANSRRLSRHTIADYGNTFRKFRGFLAPEDPPVAEITVERVEGFLAAQDHLSNKTLLNLHTGLSALWTWAVKKGIAQEHILHQVARPRPEVKVIEIFTEEEVQKVLNGCARSRSYRHPRKRKCSNPRPSAARDRAIVLMLLDSLVRVSELCEALISRTDLARGTIKIVKTKVKKERYVPISSETADAIWYYLSIRRTPKPRYADFLFLNRDGRPLNKDSLGKVLRELGRKVGVSTNAHKFRHTGATLFLRNGGDVFSLQAILGHSTMNMVRRYVHLSKVDIETAHRRASPVYNWDLRV